MIKFDELDHNETGGLIQLKVNVAHFRGGNRLSQSAQRVCLARPTQRTLQIVHKCRNLTLLCFGLLLSDTRLAGNHRFCHEGVGYRSSFPASTWNSQFLSFLSPKFELVPFPHLHLAVFFHFSRRVLASLWLKKVWPFFISGYSLKKR